MLTALRQQKYPFGSLRPDPHWSVQGLIFHSQFKPAGKLIDETTNKNDGTIVGPTWVGQGLTFAETQYVTIADKDIFTMLDGFTVITNVNPTTIDDDHGLVSKYFDHSAFVGEWALAIQSDGKAWGQCLDGGPTDRIKVTSSFTLATNTWVRLAFTYDGSAVNTGLEIYKNGVLDTGSTHATDGSFAAMANTVAPLELGVTLRDSIFRGWFIGSMDYVLIYDRTLSPAEIAELTRNPDLPFQQYPAWWGKAPAAPPVTGLSGIYYRTVMQGAR